MNAILKTGDEFFAVDATINGKPHSDEGIDCMFATHVAAASAAQTWLTMLSPREQSHARVYVRRNVVIRVVGGDVESTTAGPGYPVTLEPTYA
jgi:hypothetical protein